MRTTLFASLSLVFALGGCGDSDVPDPGTYGAPCGECASGLACVADARFPGGYCSATCADGMCAGEADCEIAAGASLCLARCEATADCRDGYQCWRGNCHPACVGDGDCGSGGSCTGGQCTGPACLVNEDCMSSMMCSGGSCVPLGPDGGLGLAPGTPCVASGDCASGVCLPEALGGFCTATCVNADQCFVFAVEAACSAVPTDTDGDGAADSAPTYCVPLPSDARRLGAACERDDQCAARICQDGQCTEVCASELDCAVNQVCATLTRSGTGGATYAGCGYRPRVGDVSIEEVDLGEVTLGAGFLENLEIATPSDTVSLTLSARRGSGDPLDLSFVTVVDPSGTTLFDVSEIIDLRDQPIRWLPIDTGESITMLVPNTTPDRVRFQPGLHRWSVSLFQRTMDDTGAASVALSALIKRAAPGADLGGTLDLNVFLASGLAVDAASAAGDARLSGTLARLDALLGAAGISLGEVSYFDIASAGFDIIDAGETSTELADLFRLSAGRSGRRLDIFLVRSIDGGDAGFSSLGIAGGIPGPVGVHGTQHSGVVASFDPSVVGTGATGARVVGHILAHEIGHYIGLFHATERLRPCGPGETPADGCSPFDAGDQLVDTSRGDTSNLMYWSIVGDGSNESTTAGQQFVLRASALVGP